MHVSLLIALGAWTLSTAEAPAPSSSAPASTPAVQNHNGNGQSAGAPMPGASMDRLSGYVSGEGRFFFHDPLYPGQADQDGSLAAQPEYYHQWQDGSSFTFTPFGRFDSADSRRTHWDIRELNYLYPRDDWFFRVGVGKVFWGATEFVHLVDIVNQTDLVEHIDGEDKLGQPMVEFSITKGWGTLDVFFLPYFRERTFPGRKGRLRPALVIDTEHPLYRSSAEQSNVDAVARYSRTFGDIDFGIYVFKGTNRDPLLIPSDVLDPNDAGERRLIPFYDQITQVGTDIQWAVGNWLWKLEALWHDGYLGSYTAAVGGVEYTLVGFAGSQTDVGLVAEYAWDERGDDPTTTSIFDNDLFLGLRLTPNDPDSTLLLAGVMQDLGEAETVVTIEASRRLGSHWRLSLDAWFFLAQPEDSILYDIRADDFLRLELAYFW